MTIALAIEYIPRRMRDLGFENNYYLRFKHLIIQPFEKMDVDAENQFYILVEEIADISIISDCGHYDLADTRINEQSYEHQGTITIENQSSQFKHIRFIQVIPKN
jgi:hypothetical protein